MKLVKGDITQETSGALLQGCNTIGGYGSGLAGAIRRKWPHTYLRFKEVGTGKHLLGTIDIIPLTDKLFLINGYTQEFCGNDGKRYASLEAIDMCLQKSFAWCHVNNIELKTVQIGCGLGGLHWDEVRPLIEKYEIQYNTDTKIFYI